MRGRPKLHEINIEETINEISIDSSLRNLLQVERFSKFDFSEMRKQTLMWSKSVMRSLTRDEIKAIDQFYELKTFQPNLVDEKGILHEKTKDHPAIK